MEKDVTRDPETILLDSVILIDHFNGRLVATDYILGLDLSRCFISVITRAEVLAGCKNEDESALALLFLNRFACLVLNEDIADYAAELRKKYKWRLPDAIQAAFALRNSFKLATRNVKDFDAKSHVFVVNPYKI